MIARTTVLLALLASVLVQYVIPDKPVYQYGWYSVAIAALFVIALFQSKSTAKNIWTSGIAVLRIGIGLIALAGVANGLLAPSPQTVIGAPGTTVPVADLHGSLQFSSELPNANAVFATGAKLCGALHVIGSFEVWCEPRDVVSVQAFDANGAHLTVTQPNGLAFLSPVLLFIAKQTIAGIPLPYDSFAIPAAHRIVNAVYFDARHAAALRGITTGEPAVLFAVDDDANQPLPNSIDLARPGERIAIGGVQLSAQFSQYPAVRIAPVPLPLLVFFGLLGIGLGMFLHIREATLCHPEERPEGASRRTSA